MNKISKNYAKSFFQKILAEYKELNDSIKIKKEIAQCLEELSLLSAMITNSKKVNNFFKDPFFSEQKKYDFLAQIVPNRNEKIESLLKLLVEKRNLFLLPEIFHQYKSFADKFNKIQKVKLITASALDKNLGKIFFDKLKNVLKAKEIVVEVDYNKDLIGGIILEFESSALDASIVREFKGLIKEI